MGLINGYMCTFEEFKGLSLILRKFIIELFGKSQQTRIKRMNVFALSIFDKPGI